MAVDAAYTVLPTAVASTVFKEWDPEIPRQLVGGIEMAFHCKVHYPLLSYRWGCNKVRGSIDCALPINSEIQYFDMRKSGVYRIPDPRFDQARGLTVGSTQAD